jgi:hypothetical protein
MITEVIPSLAGHHLFAPHAIPASGRKESDRSAQFPANAETWSLAIYESAMAVLLERIEQFLKVNDCQVLDQDVCTTHLFSGAEQYKAVLTLGVSRPGQAKLQLWYDTNKTVGDIDLDPVFRGAA